MSENQTPKTEVYQSDLVKTFTENLRTGKSFLMDANEKPSYVMNPISKEVYKGMNMLAIGQAFKDENVIAPYAATYKQITTKWDKENNKEIQVPEEDRFYLKDGTKAIAVTYPKLSAYDENGKKKKDENGQYANDTNYVYLYPAEEFYKANKVPKKDKNGNVMTWSEDIYKKDKKGNIETYKKDGEYPIGNLTFKYKAGDPVIKHHKGSVVMETVLIPEQSFVPKQTVELPSLINNDVAPLYKRKNNSGSEILMEKLTEAFRGKLEGNYQGMKITPEEINEIEKTFIQHPKMFSKIANTAYDRATVSKEIVEKIDAANEKRMQAQNEQQNVNQNTNENTKKSKGRH